MAGAAGNSVLGVAGAAVSSAGGSQSGAAGSSAGSGGALITDPGTDGDGTIGIAAPFKAAPEMSEQPGVTKGQLLSFTMANSTTFGDGARKVALYLPAGYVSGTELPFIVAQDGISPQNGGSFGLDDLRPLLDNMIADPQGRCAFGGSSGGAAAFTMGWFHPESYARILTISGTFVGLQSTAQYPDGGAEYPEHLIPDTTPNEPLRVFMSAGSNDLGGGRWRAANDAKALAAKQYHYRGERSTPNARSRGKCQFWHWLLRSPRVQGGERAFSQKRRPTSEIAPPRSTRQVPVLGPASVSRLR